jgi:hypothetical protein
MAKVYVTISADWDGDFGYTLDAIALVKKQFANGSGKFAGIPITHFITPVYFTRNNGGLERRYIAATQDLLATTTCEVGLHVHCWQSLLQCIGVPYLEACPGTSWDASSGGRGQYDPEMTMQGKKAEPEMVMEYGHSVPLWFYNATDIGKILELSRRVLVNQGTGGVPADIVGFRCGGWMTDDKVFKALIAKGFTYDSSAMDLSVCDDLNDPRGDLTKFRQYLALLWGPVQRHVIPANTLYHAAYPSGVAKLANAQPKPVTWGGDSILEIPNTCTLADYVSEEAMTNHIKEALQLVKTSGEDVYVSIGFHIDTATFYLDRVTNTVAAFMKNDAVQFVTCKAVRARF